MFEKYTEAARRVIFFARYEVSQFGGTKIETEHLLLGLLRVNKDLIRRFAADWKSIGDSLREIAVCTYAGQKTPTTIDMPLSDECKRILAYASEEAERLSHSHIGPEHLLLGILREPDSAAAQVLKGHGVQLLAVRKDVASNPDTANLRQASTLPAAGCVPDAETAKQIAQVIWRAMYSEDVVLKQEPLQVEISEDIWTIRGSSGGDPAGETLIAVISKKDSRILKVGTVVFRRDFT